VVQNAFPTVSWIEKEGLPQRAGRRGGGGVEVVLGGGERKKKFI